MADNEDHTRHSSSTVSRRTLVTALAAGAGAIALAPRVASAADAAGPMAPPSTVTTPPRDFGPQRRADHLFHGP